MIEEKIANDLLDFIYNSPTAFHTVKVSEELLINSGFKNLTNEENWHLKKGGKYFISKNQSSLIAFAIGNGDLRKEGFRLIASHTDSPGFRIKAEPEMIEDNYVKLNTEVYGGPILNTWLDRPLSISGRVSLRSDNPFKPKMTLVNINKPVLNIPNLAIHLNS